MAEYAYDDWVGQVRPDPRNTDQLTLVQGYIGQSSESGHIRVYSDESLNDFVEVPEDAIVHAQQLSQAESSLGGSKLWLRSDVVITYGDPKSANRPRTTFLEGDLMQQYTTQYGGGYDPTGGMGAYGGQPAGQGGQFMASVAQVNCPSVLIVQCQPQITLTKPNCPIIFQTATGPNCKFPRSIFVTQCPPLLTKPIICQITKPGPACPMPTGFACPSWVGCPPTGNITDVINPGQAIQPGGFGGQPDTTPYGGGFDTTGGFGGQFMGSAICPTGPVPCPPLPQPFTVPFNICKINLNTFIRTRCCGITIIKSLGNPVSCTPVACGFTKPGFTCPQPTGFACPSWAGCPSIACGPNITDVINPGPVIQPGGGFMGQPDTTTGGYYGQFNPYTTMYY